MGIVGEDSKFPESEKRVNAAAADFLVPQSELSDFIARIHPHYSRESVKGFAGRLKIHPGLVVGQLQHQKRISQAHMRDFLEKVRATLIASAVTDGWGYLPNIEVGHR